jgi:hypoxanthine phosphoribosyltransferase
MNPHSFPCQLVSWDEAYRLSRKLAYEIKSSGFHPDLIIAIGRGGYVPARIVSDFLLHSLLTSIKVEHWDNAARKRPEATVRFPLAVDIQGQKILIVDDVTDTGETLRVTADYVRSLHAGEIRTGVMQHKTVSPIVPDFYAEVITEWRWIIYPWAAHEDLVGFAERVLSEQPATIKQICERLKERYSLVVDENEMPEILADLMAIKKAKRCGDRYMSEA